MWLDGASALLRKRLAENYGRGSVDLDPCFEEASRLAVAGNSGRTCRSRSALDRLRVLVDAGIALSSELSLDALLQQLVETAAQLTGAQYAALGVIDSTGQGLERFLTTGIDPETHAAIGDLPRGRGILGVLIRDAQPLRLHDLGDDPRSVGFPAHHPPMRSFLGVPILLRGVAYGNLYLTEKIGGGDFTDEDEELTQLLAAQAAVAIENTRLYETSTRWLRHFESMNEIGDALAGELELEPLLGLVARRLRSLIQARLVLIALPDAGADGAEHQSRRRRRIGCVRLVGMPLELGGSKTGRVLQRGRSERVDSVLDDPEIDQQTARRMGIRSALYVPLVVRGRPMGVVVAHDKLGATLELHRRRRPAHRVARYARGHGGRPVRARQPGCRPTRRRGAGGSSALDWRASSTTRPGRR